MMLLRPVVIFWKHWVMRDANFDPSEFFMRESLSGDENVYTQNVKSLDNFTLTVAADLGWDMSWVGSVTLVCCLWNGPLMGWVGDIRGGWVGNPVSFSRSHLVGCFFLFVWSVGLNFVPFPYFCHRLLVRGHNWCWMVGVIVNPGDIRLDRLGGLSIRCSPPCSHTLMPETDIGFRNHGVNFILFSGGVGLWVELLTGDLFLLSSCGFVYVWVHGNVMYRALMRWQLRSLRSYVSWKHHMWYLEFILQCWSIHRPLNQVFGFRGKMGNYMYGQLLKFKRLVSRRYPHSRQGAIDSTAWDWFILRLLLSISRCFGWMTKQRECPRGVLLLGVIIWIGLSPGSWDGGWVVTCFGPNQTLSKSGLKKCNGLFAGASFLDLLMPIVHLQVLNAGPTIGGISLVLGCGIIKAHIQIWDLQMMLTKTQSIVMGLGGSSSVFGTNRKKAGVMYYGSLWAKSIRWAVCVNPGLSGLSLVLEYGPLWAQIWMWVAVKFLLQAQFCITRCGGPEWYSGLAGMMAVLLGRCRKNQRSGLISGLARVFRIQLRIWPGIKTWSSNFGLMCLCYGKENSEPRVYSWKSISYRRFFIDVSISYLCIIALYCIGNVFPCSTRFLFIPSRGCMVSYFWSPKYVLGDMAGGMPPLKV
ncbi:hypothetical protein HanLR1_Chr17g0688451 [Helianthus annuus]|nr:hypothetical protein HanLR1_Chr17g0688451 [Helianthus annuus]